jgi:hypothetical protein
VDAARPPAREATGEDTDKVRERKGGRRRRLRLVVTALAVASLATAAAALLLPRGTPGARDGGGVTVVSSPSAASATADTARSTRGGTAPEPSVFLGGIGAGRERTAVISVATGAVLRYLTPPPGSPTLGVLSPDRRIWFEPAGDGPCGSAWRAIAVSSGASAPALAGEGGIETLALSPDGRRVALVKARSRDASGCGHRLVVRDLRAGTERSWPLDPALRLSQIAWSPDGNLLAYELNGEATGARHQLRVVRVASMRAVEDGLALRAPGGGCRLGLPRFRAGSGRLVVAEHCDGGGGSLGRALLEYDPARGALVRTLARVPGEAMITDLSVDASGQHVLVLLFPSESSEATAYALRDGSLRRVFRGAFTASW